MQGYRGFDSDESRKVDVLYEDNHLIAVLKPFGLLTQGDASGEPSLLELTRAHLKEKYAKPGNVFLGLLHRLDKPVGGVVLFAKTSKAASRLSEQFRSRDVEKIYRAVVEGVPKQAEAELVHYLGNDASERVEVRASPWDEGKVARLSYRQIRAWGTGALLEIELGTGRKHQIRAQLAAIGHPIRGDRKYGAKSPAWENAIALVSRRLTFSHPIRQEERVTVELTDDQCPLRELQS